VEIPTGRLDPVDLASWRSCADGHGQRVTEYPRTNVVAVPAYIGAQRVVARRQESAGNRTLRATCERIDRAEHCAVLIGQNDIASAVLTRDADRHGDAHRLGLAGDGEADVAVAVASVDGSQNDRIRATGGAGGKRQQVVVAAIARLDMGGADEARVVP